MGDAREESRATRRVLTGRAGIAALAIVTVAGICAAVAAGSSGGRPAAGPRSALVSPFGLGNDEGAAVAGMTEYEAENAATNAAVIGPSYVPGTLASEASGRAAVQLRAPGQYVQFRLRAPANALDISYSLPPGTTATLAVYVNGARLAAGLPLTSARDYLPAPAVHHFFDDARMLLGRQLAAGATVRLQAGPGAAAVSPTIDVADFYQVPAPASQPRRSVSVVAEGADPAGQADSAAAFRKAITAAAAAREPVWIPPGSYQLSSPLQVARATILGAGDWYSQITATQFIANPAAVPGPVNLSGFAVLAPANAPAAAGTAAISGSLGTGSTVNGLWIQDASTGIWLRYRTTRATVENCEILSASGDGINIDGNTASSWLRNNFIRNTAGDALALWSDTSITVTDNTIVTPNLGSGIAVYGGAGAGIIDNVIADAGAPGSGITIADQTLGQPGFDPLSGTVTVGDNTVLRSGAPSSHSRSPAGAFRIDSYNYPLSHVTLNIIDNAIDDSPYSAFVIASGRGAGLPVTGVHFDSDTINGAGTVAVQAQTSGSATFSHTTATHIGVAGIYNSPSPASHHRFTFRLGAGNTGWTTTPALTTFPAPAGPAAPITTSPGPRPGTSTPHPPTPAPSPPPPARHQPPASPPSSSRPSPRPTSTPRPVITASASSVPRGASVTFWYSTPAGTRSSTNWIAVYTAGLATDSYLHAAWAYAPGASGSVTFSTSSFIGSGRYDVYYFYNNTLKVLAGSIGLTVTGAHPTLTASAASVRSGSQVTYRYSAPAGMQTSTNWIGIFPYNRYIGNVNNTIISHAAPGASGSVTFSTNDLPGAGVYYVFYLYQGGYMWLRGPVSLSVTGG
jgi:Pectate lyase superfamily protein